MPGNGNSGFGRLGRQYNPPPPADRQPRSTTRVEQILDRKTLDEFSNVLARIGYGTPSLLESTSYPLTRLTRNYILMQSLYRSNWIARKVVDAIPEDMLKNWLELTIEGDPEALDAFNKAIRKTYTRSALLATLKWARLFGGAGAVIMIDGHEEMLDQPLDLEEVGLGAYKGLLVFDRWSGIYPDLKLSDDIDRPVDFGLPEYYQVNLQDGSMKKVHSSRVLRFIGRELPYWEKQTEQYWGCSEYEVMYTELRKRDNTSLNIANLVFRANILAMKNKDLAQFLATGTAQAQQRMYSVLSSIDHLMSNQGLMILPEDGGLESHQYSFPGINDIYQSFMMDICGATEIPFTRLFGRTVTGLGQSNEGDNQIYFGMLAQKQEREITPQLDKLFPVIAMSAWGEVPDDLDFRWMPIRELSDKEMADLSTASTGNVVAAFNAGLVSQRTALKEFKQKSKVTGDWTNITDEDVAAADDQTVTPAEQQKSAQGPQGGGGGEMNLEEEGNALPPPPEEDQDEFKDEEIRGQLPAYTGDAARGFRAAWVRDAARKSVGNLNVFIEQPAGSMRRGTAPDGVEWLAKFTVPYGYIENTVGADGEAVDVFLGPHRNSNVVYVIHQNTLEGKYDEDKVMLGFTTAREAKETYFENYDRPQRFFRSMEEMPFQTFIKLLTWKAHDVAEFKESEHPRAKGGGKGGQFVKKGSGSGSEDWRSWGPENRPSAEQMAEGGGEPPPPTKIKVRLNKGTKFKLDKTKIDPKIQRKIDDSNNSQHGVLVLRWMLANPDVDDFGKIVEGIRAEGHYKHGEKNTLEEYVMYDLRALYKAGLFGGEPAKGKEEKGTEETIEQKRQKYKDAILGPAMSRSGNRTEIDVRLTQLADKFMAAGVTLEALRRYPLRKIILKPNSGFAGQYTWMQKSIQLTPRSRIETFAHEFGHHLDGIAVSERDFNYYKLRQPAIDELYEARKKATDPDGRSLSQYGTKDFRYELALTGKHWRLNAGGAVSSYALWNQYEWISENFENYVMKGGDDPVMRERFPATYKYLDKLAGKSEPPGHKEPWRQSEFFPAGGTKAVYKA